MSTAELKQIKVNLVTWINQLSGNDLITFLEGVRISSANTDWWEGLSTDQKKQILSGIKDTDEGRVMESKEFWESLSNFKTQYAEQNFLPMARSRTALVCGLAQLSRQADGICLSR